MNRLLLSHFATLARRAKHQHLLWVCCSIGFLAFSAIWVLHAAEAGELGWDFTQFYIVAHLPFSDLYDRETYLGLAAQLFEGTNIHYFPPFVRPAVFKLVLTPLSWFSYWTAFVVWCAVVYGAYVTFLWLLRRIHPYPPETLLAGALFYPPMHGLWEGQDAPVVTLLLLLAFLQLRAGRHALAGILFGLCVYKYNLFTLVPLYLLVNRQCKVFLWGSLVAGSLLGVSSLLQSPARYLAWLRAIPEMTIGFSPTRTSGLLGLAGGNSVIYLASLAALVPVGIWAMRRGGPDRGFAIAVTGSLLAAYHVASYDLTALLIPVAIAMRSGDRPSKALGLLLVLGIPLWLTAPRNIGFVVLLLFVTLVAGTRRPAGCHNVPATEGA
jgi:hypothetical protein